MFYFALNKIERKKLKKNGFEKLRCLKLLSDRNQKGIVQNKTMNFYLFIYLVFELGLLFGHCINDISISILVLRHWNWECRCCNSVKMKSLHTSHNTCASLSRMRIFTFFNSCTIFECFYFVLFSFL